MPRPVLRGSMRQVAAALLLCALGTGSLTEGTTIPSDKCNGSSDYCILPFDHFTLPGTHNSAAYDLVPDCAVTKQCQGGMELCASTSSKCSGSWRSACVQTANKCLDRLDGKSNMWAKFGKSVCKSWAAVCAGPSVTCDIWEDVCKVPVHVCSTGLPLICKNTPHWFKSCIWENQPDHDIAQQLADGIRSFDIDLCEVEGGEILTCHGQGPTRALGAPLDVHLQQVRDFMIANPREVISLEYGDYDGSEYVIGVALQKKLEEYLPGKILEHGDKVDDPWPTLGEMIQTGKQAVVFVGAYGPSIPDKPRWMIDRRPFYSSTWSYTNDRHTAKDMASGMLKHVEDDERKTPWECLDFEYSPNAKSVLDSVLHLKKPEVCLGDMAQRIRDDIAYVADSYSNKFHRIHRMRVDYYFSVKDVLFTAVAALNTLNVARFQVEKYATIGPNNH
ncbi:PLC-like phosphodiesterase [Thamnocephalis sphaerospora]|uniref:PLC-like phosphodiesterase n=1 Tax=Thamnocephalis sphaerospora TaxID=78915 RepID=A0A4P9XJT5_9FUNG|nr:PLC-like phosphodiesterase [Thamnocephalis sphaerospora]|eukprot:RKP06002.1 PLC-like phosphodiesterase [Thamnocephalis sphaerospora]